MSYDAYGYGYGYDPYGYDPYGGWGGEYEPPPQEDTESQKLRKEQEMIEALESNRLYLKKVRKQCVKEDFADLEKPRLFLMEVLIESLEVNTESSLGLTKDSDEPPELVARVQFLNSPSLEIRDKGEAMETSDSVVVGQTEYFQTVNNAGLTEAVRAPTKKEPKKEVKENSKEEGKEEDPGSQNGCDDKSENIKFDTKWNNSNGKSCLFSKSALDMIQGLDNSPLKIQVSRCVEIKKEVFEEQNPNSEYSEEEGEYEENDNTSKSSQESQTFSCEPLGYAFIRLPEYFSLSILQSCKPGVLLPVACTHRDVYDLRNVFGVKKGKLQVFVRLSSFGPIIITSFQSEGKDRQYKFKPSPLPVDEEESSEIHRDLYLKPILAEEGTTIGITVVKEDDTFRKPVVWRNAQNCGCMEEGLPIDDYTSESSLRMPCPSDSSLCRDSTTPGRMRQHSDKGCDWHDLVSKEIKNSPIGNCGCMGSVQPQLTTQPQLQPQLTTVSPKKSPRDTIDEKTSPKFPIESPTERIPSRVLKMMPKVPIKKEEPIKGIMIKPEPVGCKCNCAQIRTSLELKPMMKYDWHIK